MAVGRVLKPHGVRGEVKVEPLTPDPERFRDLARVFATAPGKETRELAIASCRILPGAVLLRFAGCDSPEEAADLRGRTLEIPREEARRVPPGEVLYADMVGLLAIDASTGEPFGPVTAIVSTGQDLLEIAAPGGDILVPWVPAFVGAIDLAAGTVEIRPIPGLMDP